MDEAGHEPKTRHGDGIGTVLLLKTCIEAALHVVGSDKVNDRPRRHRTGFLGHDLLFLTQ